MNEYNKSIQEKYQNIIKNIQPTEPEIETQQPQEQEEEK